MDMEPVSKLERESKPASHGVAAMKETMEAVFERMSQIGDALRLLADDQGSLRDHVVQWQATQAHQMQPLQEAIGALLTLATTETDPSPPWYRQKRMIGLLAGHLLVGLLGGYVVAATLSEAPPVPREVQLMRDINKILVSGKQGLPKGMLKELDSVYKEHRFKKVSEQKGTK